MTLSTDNHPNRIVELFVNKTLLITGGSGFLGKVLIEKLLRSCTGLRKIYVIVRPKKGKDPNERLAEILEGPLFDLVTSQHGKSVLAKVEAVSGDIGAPDLGLSEIDRKKLVEEVEIIYHSAATVRFDEPFKRAVSINVRGTKLMLALAKECKKLMVMCHLSTAYCHEEQKVLYEKTYPPPADPHRIIQMCDWMGEDVLDTIIDKIRGTSANNYTFTKALGEGLVEEQMDKLPVILVRPSAVIPIWKEPLPGWTDNINGPTGLLIGAGKGVIRTMYGRGDTFIDYLPADMLANGLICSAYDYVTHKTRRVFNFTSSDEYKMSFQEILDMGKKIVTTEVPFNWMLWYPGGSMKPNRVLHTIDLILFQLLPALLVDTLLLLLGQKPILMRVQKRIIKGYQVFEYYANSQWDFRSENKEIVRKLLNPEEKRVFRVEIDGFDCYKYFTQCTLGARRYLINERDEDIPSALKRMKMMWWVDKFCKILIVAGFFYFIYQQVFVRFF